MWSLSCMRYVHCILSDVITVCLRYITWCVHYILCEMFTLLYTICSLYCVRCAHCILCDAFAALYAMCSLCSVWCSRCTVSRVFCPPCQTCFPSPMFSVCQWDSVRDEIVHIPVNLMWRRVCCGVRGGDNEATGVLPYASKLQLRMTNSTSSCSELVYSSRSVCALVHRRSTATTQL